MINSVIRFYNHISFVTSIRVWGWSFLFETHLNVLWLRRRQPLELAEMENLLLSVINFHNLLPFLLGFLYTYLARNGDCVCIHKEEKWIWASVQLLRSSSRASCRYSPGWQASARLHWEKSLWHWNSMCTRNVWTWGKNYITIKNNIIFWWWWSTLVKVNLQRFSWVPFKAMVFIYNPQRSLKFLPSKSFLAKICARIFVFDRFLKIYKNS